MPFPSRLLAAGISCLLAATACTSGTDSFVADLMDEMTLDEKLGQMTLIENNSATPADVETLVLGGILSGGDGAPDDNTVEEWAAMVGAYDEAASATRLGIPLIYGVDAVHGHALLEGATVFPHNIGLGAAGDEDLVERIGRATAVEMAATGIRWNYAPVLAVVQDTRWGRTYESYGADPDLVGRLGSAFMRGLEGDDLSEPASVLATPKHFVGDGGTVFGTSTTGDYLLDQGVTEADESTLREVHVAPYTDIVPDAGSVMASFSSWENGKVHGDPVLLTSMLRDELGFGGFLVSDWAGIDQIAPDDYRASVIAAINAGVDMNMVPTDALRFIDTVREAVESGEISEPRIDEAVRRILTTKVEMGLFDDPEPLAAGLVRSEDHQALAREAVAKSATLLKTTAGLLPLAQPEAIFVSGPADDLGRSSGGWTLEWQGVHDVEMTGATLLDGLTESFPDADIQFNATGGFEGRAPIGIAVVAELPYAEGWGDSETPAVQWSDLQALTRLRSSVDQLIVVIVSGRPIAHRPFESEADAVIAAWLPGSEAAGLADVLSGEMPFTGTLPVAWPASSEDHDRHGKDGCDGVAWPMGHGLAADGSLLGTAPCE